MLQDKHLSINKRSVKPNGLLYQLQLADISGGVVEFGSVRLWRSSEQYADIDAQFMHIAHRDSSACQSLRLLNTQSRSPLAFQIFGSSTRRCPQRRIVDTRTCAYGFQCDQVQATRILASQQQLCDFCLLIHLDNQIQGLSHRDSLMIIRACHFLQFRGHIYQRVPVKAAITCAATRTKR